jgi:Cys-tRNA(Pro)/Cys-tRNA(Cys) deacylase
MAKTTPATLALQKAGVAFALHAYAYDPDAPRIGLHAAESLGVEPGRVLKTLMAEVDGKPVCAVLASDREVAMKRLAAAAGGRSAQMMKPGDAERITGYHVGGVSPFGQKRRVATVVDAAALGHGRVFVNAGQRGLQAELAPADLVAALGAQVAEIS